MNSKTWSEVLLDEPKNPACVIFFKVKQKMHSRIFESNEGEKREGTWGLGKQPLQFHEMSALNVKIIRATACC